MITLNGSQLPGHIANALMLRGSALPPLRWFDAPNRAAKEILDQAADDTGLFQLAQPVDESMCAAVRGMLYLFNGWPAECAMYAAAAPEKERVYLTALAHRQTGAPAEAKAAFQQIGDHPIYKRLAQSALQIVGVATDRALDRFKQIVELGEAWEPFAFTDLYEQARAEILCSATENTVRKLLYSEFELLFVHCYEAGTGKAVLMEPAGQTDTNKRKRPPARRAPETRNRPGTVKPPAAPQTRKTPKPQFPHKPQGIGILCPGCSHLCKLAEDRRGTKHQCPGCKRNFLVPTKKPMPASRRGPGS